MSCRPAAAQHVSPDAPNAPGFPPSHRMTERISKKDVPGLSYQHTDMCVMCEHTRVSNVSTCV